ncbi:MAG: DUF4335 domain-containing protein [Phormidesmis sp. CAN_BIN36]|nr:DUF4335 domain-containing protein [Phormidesmis sp. CAN_BIN36]
MSFSTSVTRRYTPPTCTLAISAKDSPLSRWMGRSMLKHLRFKLSFDDPRVSDERWITVQGDRPQLELLSHIVTVYVQAFLNQSTTLLNAAHRLENEVTPGLNPAITSTFVMSRPTLSNPNSASEVDPNKISIQPIGILSHELFLGTLATEESGASIRLSAVQLADLASALDDYAADVTALPNLNRPAWAKSPPWTSLAATALIAFGLTASVLRLLDRPAPNPTVATSSQGASSSDQRLAVQPLPSSPSPSPLATLPIAPPLNAIPNPPAPSINQTTLSTGTLPKITVPPANSFPVEPPPGAITIQPAPSDDRPNAYPVSPVPGSLAEGNTKIRSALKPPVAEQNVARERTAIAPSSSRALSQDSTASNTIPQVAEVRQFFQKQWKARPELTE